MRPVVAFLSLLLGQALAGEYLLPATPALDLFSDDIVFYKSFNDEATGADMAVGEGKALRVNGKLRLKPGLWGQAMLFGDGEGAELEYAMAGNMPVPRPGSLAFWICPLEWKRAADEPSIYFFHAFGAGVMCLQRQGDLEGGRKRGNCFVFTCHGLPGIPNITASTTSDATRTWRNGEWHLVVIAWRPSLLEAYLDGEALPSITLKRPIKAEEFAKGRFRIGVLKGEPSTSLGPGPTLLDDFAVFRRPLTPAEVKSLWSRRPKS
ncbi:MAG: LamG domain-containing protein [Planctomycetes bacterium]|nr:LamG domain-containing protein [Planctomycetota bacterium]